MNLQEELKALKERIAELEELTKEEREFPQDGDAYWFIDDEGGMSSTFYKNYYLDIYRQKIGNIFRTEEEAEFAAKKLRVEAELRKFSRPFKEDEYNYFIQINSSHNNIVVDSDDCYQTQGTIYFKSTTIANEATDTV
ncbi:hypothetical protein, partial [Jeotgalibaca porci]